MYGYKLQKPNAIPKITRACKSKVEQSFRKNKHLQSKHIFTDADDGTKR